jgi:hypothetical protein
MPSRHVFFGELGELQTFVKAIIKEPLATVRDFVTTVIQDVLQRYSRSFGNAPSLR